MKFRRCSRDFYCCRNRQQTKENY